MPYTVLSQIFGDSDRIGVRDVELRAEDDHQRLREKLARVVLDEMYQFVALLSTDGTLLEVNRAALEGAGIRLEEIQGKPFWEARWWSVSPETVATQREACRRAAAGEFVRYDVEIYGQASGEETIIIDYSLIPVKDHRGEVVFLLPEGRNITEKKRAEAEIARKNQELQLLLDRVRELDELKSRFFANVSHELRTPLALILGPTERLLAEGGNLTGAQRRDVEVVRRNASMLLKHVNDLLDITKLDAGKMAAVYGETDLAALVRTLAGHFEALAPQRGIAFVIDAPGSLMAEVDADKVERVLLNLLSNAFKFTPDGGRVRCALSEGAGGRALLSVQDSGPGVQPELREAIFQRFRQGDGGSTRQFGGTGLGLAIVRDFVDLHGGFVTVTDAPGGGALFLVDLPLKAPAGAFVRRRGDRRQADTGPVLAGTLEELAPEAPAAEPAGPGREGRPCVLVVEDNAELRRFVQDVLADGYRVETAADGRAGLEKAEALRPDLVVTDLMMPVMSGDQMIAELRRNGSGLDMPVLVLSAKADDALRVRLLSEGAQDYLLKPFSAAELRARVGNLVSIKRARDVLRREVRSRNDDLEALALEVACRNQDLERTAGELRDSEARFRAITESMPQIVWSARPDGHHDYYNPRWYEFTGVPQGSTDGEGWSAIFHPDDRSLAWEQWRHSLSTGEPYEIEYRLRHRSGEYRWVLGRALPVRGPDGGILRWMGTCTDIHDLKQAEERQRLLTAELSHRVKNALAVVQSIAHQTLRRSGSLAEFSGAFQGRLQALSEAHGLLLRSRWSSVPLTDLLRTELAPYESGGAIRLDGPEVGLGPRQGVALALILHELATNAAKYGALSVPEGRLHVGWRLDGAEAQRHLRLAWTETGLPAAPALEPEGFGTRLIRRSAANELGGTAAPTVDGNCLRWNISFNI